MTFHRTEVIADSRRNPLPFHTGACTDNHQPERIALMSPLVSHPQTPFVVRQDNGILEESRVYEYPQHLREAIKDAPNGAGVFTALRRSASCPGWH